MSCELTTAEVAYIDQTIADLRAENAKLRELGRGTCYIDLVGYNQREERYQCRSCDWSMWLKRGTWPRFNYCPNCGRKVTN